MQIVRHCKERLVGGERLWRRMARLARFDGRVEVYGYGIHGKVGKQQRQDARTGAPGTTIADYGQNIIRVWMAAPCASVGTRSGTFVPGPLFTYAHELGHHAQFLRGVVGVPAELQEQRADRYARALLTRVRREET